MSSEDSCDRMIHIEILTVICQIIIGSSPKDFNKIVPFNNVKITICVFTLGEFLKVSHDGFCRKDISIFIQFQRSVQIYRVIFLQKKSLLVSPSVPHFSKS